MRHVRRTCRVEIRQQEEQGHPKPAMKVCTKNGCSLSKKLEALWDVGIKFGRVAIVTDNKLSPLLARVPRVK